MRYFVALALALASAVPAAAQPFVYGVETRVFGVPASFGGDTPPAVRLVNAATGHVIADIPFSGARGKLARLRQSGDGRFLAIADRTGDVFVVDTVTKRVNSVSIRTSTASSDVADVVVLPDSSRIYAVDQLLNRVVVIDVATLTIAATVAVQATPSRIVATPDGNAVYVTNNGSGTVSKISTATNTIAATITVHAQPDALDISPDGSRLFVANLSDGSISVIDVALDSLLRTLTPAPSVAASPIDLAAQSATRVYVAYQAPTGGNHSVALIDAASGSVAGSVAVPRPWVLARNATATSVALTSDGAATGVSTQLQLLASDGNSATIANEGGNMRGLAIVDDPCAFEATMSRTVFHDAGGSGTLTIPTPAGCSWAVDATAVAGLSFTPASGTGPATPSFTLASASTPQYAPVEVGRQTFVIRRTIPAMNADFASGSTVQEPFSIGGWALELNAEPLDAAHFFDAGVRTVHVWAYPAAGAPIFVGVALSRGSRPDVAAAFGNRYADAGFSITVSSLPSGRYTLVFYAQSIATGTFDNARTLDVTVVQAAPRVTIDTPRAGATVGRPFAIAGWAIDPAATSGSGIDLVHVWAYPASGGAPTFVGQADYGFLRPDVAGYYGPRFEASGYSLMASLPPGRYTLVVFAHSTVSAQFVPQTATITVPDSSPVMFIDAPAAAPPAPIPPGGVDPGTRLSSPFDVVGWALDRGVTSGPSTDFVHVWAYPVSGAPPIFVGAAQRTSRPDVAAVFGPNQQFAGFFLRATLAPGMYDLVVYARSVLTQTFNDARVVRITVQ